MRNTMIEGESRLLYDLMFSDGEVVELRAVLPIGNARSIAGGYFDNGEDFAKAAVTLDAMGAEGVYFTANPCNPELLARGMRKLVSYDEKGMGATDKDIVCCRWLLIDLDPIRPAGISSSDEELLAAEQVGRKLAGYLEGECGWPRAIRGGSGNGCHIIYRLPDLPNEEAVCGKMGILQRILIALSWRFGTPQVAVDTAVFNASRAWRVYGTWARKGVSIPARPHRQAVLFAGNAKALAEVGVVSRAMVEDLASQKIGWIWEGGER